jgi:predicted nucleotidyltransferase
MAKRLADDFREFLKLCNRKRLKYLLIGGYAVGHYGYPRATADMDIWIELSSENAARMVEALVAFGFDVPELSADLFLERGKIMNDIDGVTFAKCYSARKRVRMDGIKVDVISLQHLKANKAASGRLKDLDDLEHLP